MSAFIVEGLNIVGLLVKLGANVMPLVELIKAVASSGGDPTAADWAALFAAEKPLRDKLNS